MRSGNALGVELVWKAETPPAGNYRAFIHLVDEAGQIVSQSDDTPGQSYPTNHWLADEVMVDRRELAVPDSASPGTYTLIAGLYDPISAIRLEARDDAGVRYTNDGVPVMSITVAN